MNVYFILKLWNNSDVINSWNTFIAHYYISCLQNQIVCFVFIVQFPLDLRIMHIGCSQQTMISALYDLGYDCVTHTS
jgi:hypothetical protein